MVVVMPSVVHTGYAYYIVASDEAINEFAMPIVIGFNNSHHYTSTEHVTKPSDAPFKKLASFIAKLESLVMKGKDLVTQLKDQNFTCQLEKVIKDLTDLQAVFKPNQV